MLERLRILLNFFVEDARTRARAALIRFISSSVVTASRRSSSVAAVFVERLSAEIFLILSAAITIILRSAGRLYGNRFCAEACLGFFEALSSLREFA